jgi:hypothetical protein
MNNIDLMTTRILPSRTRFTFSTSGETKEEAVEKINAAIEKLTNGEVQLDPNIHLELIVAGVNISCAPA